MQIVIQTVSSEASYSKKIRVAARRQTIFFVLISRPCLAGLPLKIGISRYLPGACLHMQGICRFWRHLIWIKSLITFEPLQWARPANSRGLGLRAFDDNTNCLYFTLFPSLKHRTRFATSVFEFGNATAIRLA